jgi:hypothetical protein
LTEIRETSFWGGYGGRNGRINEEGMTMAADGEGV